MAEYIYPNDGKIHLRYSELVRCTHGQVDRLIAERAASGRFVSGHMEFGTDRHDMWARESLQTGQTPTCFNEIAGNIVPFSVQEVEKEFVTEIAPGIVIHSRPDAISLPLQTIVDYKTVVDGTRGWKANVAQYKRSKQGKFYAFQLAIHDVRIRRVIYLCEIWNAERNKILGYDYVQQDISLADIAEMRGWAIERAAIFKAAMKRLDKSIPYSVK
jgi:hypothetical protein